MYSYIISKMKKFYITMVTDTDKSLKKIPFAKIVDGILEYDNGESDYTVYPGYHSYAYKYNL